jgi:TolB-like protein/class 3 adenylate cyclase/AraC-like DNA-binding protein/Tfp pilus assembly protein PilF
MNPTKPDRRLAAVLFTDIVGYTALMQADEARAVAARARHRAVFTEQHARYHGEILQYFGDGTLSVFPSAVEAVRCAIAMQRAFRTDPPLPLRMGLHLGDIVFDGTDIYGDGVNLASRIESMGVAGAILLSDHLNRELDSHPQLITVSLGSFELKNVSRPVEIFAVANEGILVPERAQLRGKRQTPARSIAVLPFVNRSADPDNEYFSDGMTEEIINALSRIDNLKVTSRTSSFYFKNKQLPLARIGRELNVATVVEGSVRLAGDRMRITAQLIDVAEDTPFWSETFDRDVDDLFAVQDEISLFIAERLREQTGHFELEDHLVAAPDIPVAVYKRYLRARYHLLKMSKADLDRGLAILDEIVAAHPRFALAHLAIHLGYTLLGTIGLMPAGEAFARGQPHLDRAIELDPDLPECQLALAWNLFLQDWDPAGAYRHLNRALAIRPTVDFYQSMATVLVAESKFSAALHYLETAVQLDPFSEINYHLQGFVHYAQEDFDRAIDCFDRSIELKANFSISMLYRGQALIAQGRADVALASFQQLPADEPGDILKLGGTTLAHAARGDTARARDGIRQLEDLLETDLVDRALNLLILCAAVGGRQAEAIGYVERAFAQRLPLLVYLPVEPLLKPLRELPRFRELMQEILGEATDYTPPERQYQQTLLTPEELTIYRRQLTQLMTSEQPFLDPGLTLPALAETLALPPNHLSQLLNAGFGQNFAEFVNTYRLEYFKTALADPANAHLTLLGLAYDSGFGSKTVFNTFFKKKMGRTPGRYAKEKGGEG